jgi:hypothetical protein
MSIKLTPHGKRWADVIRRELKDPESIVSYAVRELRAWKRLCDSWPKEFKLELEYGHIVVNVVGQRCHISSCSDVGYLFPH